MKTLVIHPKDKTTDFLQLIYNDIPNLTIITNGVDRNELVKLIKEHDRVIMCGHGTPNGLLSVGQFKIEGTFGYVIDRSFVSLLKEKKENIFIWCHSNRFVERYNLKGFYSGMFISEVGESEYCGIPTTQKLVTESNYKFSQIVSRYVENGLDNLFENVKREYGKLIDTNKVAEYNHRRLYLNV